MLSLSMYPNPGSRHTLIHLETHSRGPVQALVYDVAGRLVRRVYDGSLSAGAHDLPWDGRNADGRAVAAGVYLIRLSTPDGNTTGRFVLVR
jgi:flagellar hook assembly protein FlgD